MRPEAACKPVCVLPLPGVGGMAGTVEREATRHSINRLAEATSTRTHTLTRTRSHCIDGSTAELCAGYIGGCSGDTGAAGVWAGSRVWFISGSFSVTINSSFLVYVYIATIVAVLPRFPALFFSSYSSHHARAPTLSRMPSLRPLLHPSRPRTFCCCPLCDSTTVRSGAVRRDLSGTYDLGS
jgi:hypothetical protein